jgi:hypothetical protein
VGSPCASIGAIALKEMGEIFDFGFAERTCRRIAFVVSMGHFCSWHYKGETKKTQATGTSSRGQAANTTPKPIVKLNAIAIKIKFAA